MLYMKYRADKRCIARRFSPVMLLLNLKISRKACPLPWNLTRVGGLSIHIRSFLNGNTQGARPSGFSVASLLILRCGYGVASCEKRQGLRWCPGRRCQQRGGRDVPFLIAKMSENSVYDFPVPNTCDDPGGISPTAADLNVDTEHAFQSLSPGHSGVRYCQINGPWETIPE